MNFLKKETRDKEYTFYLTFMLIACGGAFIWQFFLPHLGGGFTSWGTAAGWQREIALWNVGIISVIIIALITRNREFMKILTIQSTILCWVLGINHLITLTIDFSLTYMIHVLGVLEVLLLGGIWGAVLLYKSKRVQHNKIDI